jgi:hypothetical protein
MKLTFTAAVFLGYASAQINFGHNNTPTFSYGARAAQPVWGLRSVLDHRTDAKFMETFGNHATNQANARPPLRSHVEVDESSSSSDSSSSKSSDSSSSDDKKKNVQLEDDEEVDHSGEFFKATEHEKLGDGGYKRVTPSRFAGDEDDIFMRSMIEQYALEGKNKDGSPNGQFWMDEAAARAAASEVLHTHRNLVGKERDEYLNTYFARTWAHFDVNRSGKIEVIKMPQFMRFLCSDQQMYLW